MYLGNHLYVVQSNQYWHLNIAVFYIIYLSELYETKQMSTIPTKTLKHQYEMH